MIDLNLSSLSFSGLSLLLPIYLACFLPFCLSFIPPSVGKPFKLSPSAEEVATFFAKMLDHEYTTKDMFRKNFHKDWRKVRRRVLTYWTD